MTPKLFGYLNANIFELLGLEDLPDEKKQEFLKDMGDALEERIFLKMVNTLESEDDKKEFFRLFSEEDVSDEEQQNFLKTKFPNFPDFLAEEIALFKKEIKESVDEQVAEDILTL